MNVNTRSYVEEDSDSGCGAYMGDSTTTTGINMVHRRRKDGKKNPEVLEEPTDGGLAQHGENVE